MFDQHLGWNQKKRPKRYGSKDRRGQIKNRLMIDQPPKEVEEKSRIGDWEIDAIIGANHQAALVTIVEPVSKDTWIGNLAQKPAKLVANLTIDLLAP